MLKGTTYDVSSKGFSKHITTDHATTTADVVNTVATNAVISATQVNGSLEFLTLLTAIIAIIYLRPQIYCARAFYKDCFKGRCWWHPPRQWLFDLIWFFMDAFTVVAITHYLYTSRDPAPGTDTNYYVAIYSLFIGYLGFRWFWINSFWNYHNKKTITDEAGNKRVVEYSSEESIALGFAVFFIILMFLTVTTLVILFGIRHDWWAFGFMLPVWFWLIFLIVWTGMVYSCLARCRPACNPCNSPMLGRNANKLV